MEFGYIRGEDNTVADALSRKDIIVNDEVLAAGVACVATLLEVLSTLWPKVKADILAGYTSDKFYTGLVKSLPLHDDCGLVDGLLMIESRLYVPSGHELRRSLIDEAHRRLEHLCYLKTVSELRREFFWPLMARDVEQFTQSCEVCQRTKSSTQAKPGKTLTPSVPRLPLMDLAIGFIGPLPKVNHYDMLLICKCRPSGFMRLIPTCQTDTAERVGTRFFSGWIGTFGAPSSVISDRDKLWTSVFWKALMRRTGTSFHMTTSLHPQADGRSERTNRMVGQVLRAFAAKRQGKWLESLSSVEFPINNALNVSMGFSPFKLILGRRPCLFERASDDGGSAALSKWVAICEDTWKSACDTLWLSRVQQALQHSKLYRDTDPLPPGSWVLLNPADWNGRHTRGFQQTW